MDNAGVDYFDVSNGPFSIVPGPGDINGDGFVDVIDFLLLLNAWGPCPGACPPSCAADLNDDCTVDVLDFLGLLNNWT